MSCTLAQTPIHDWHAAHGARMVDFAGWAMPVQYGSIVAEHQATRRAVGLFDISHMGRIRFDGPGSARFLDRLVTRRVSDLAPGQVVYSLVTNEAGGILDDVLVYRLLDAAGNDYHLLVVNASNREKIIAWLDSHHDATSDDCRYADLTHDWAMVAVQGPRALELVQPLCDVDLAAMPYYSAAEALIARHGGVVSRTGYTGEDGVELIVGAAAVLPLWERLLAAGQPLGAQPAGLGARDTLRLEAAMPLYGHELDEQTDPFQAGLAFAVNLDKEFPGRDALIALRQDKSRPRRIGLEIAGRRPAREGYVLLSGGQAVGRVTSGTFSPTLERPIALGYASPGLAVPGTELQVDLRGQAAAAHVVKMPFYRRAKS
ncbi:MAG: glycine cleavage system aminomethyltransferase GcvT [Pirellulales bacterium]|nr:glycine cleavage system aminomethyltransferase GcvT [Pirellulales bacterium]